MCFHSNLYQQATVAEVLTQQAKVLCPKVKNYSTQHFDKVSHILLQTDIEVSSDLYFFFPPAQ
jgi:hypothetical protein